MSGDSKGNAMEISASAVKQLRDKTGVGMMQCKSALVEAKGDVAEAEKILRKKGLAAAANKAGRATGEGVLAARRSEDASRGVLVEVNCETDFAARNQDFQVLVGQVAAHALAFGAPAAASTPDAEALAALLDAPVEDAGGRPLREVVASAVAKIGENIQVGRLLRFDAPQGGFVSSYVHTGSKIAVLVEAKGERGPAAEALLRDVAMHVAAAAPRFVRREEVSEKVLEDEKEIARDQALKAGKPAQVVEKIVQGRMEKFFGEACLLEQPFVKDPDTTVGKLLGGALEVRRFVRFVLGESA
jgi:elongation factor Ts